MTIKEFVEKYHLHDSGLNSIIIDTDKRTLCLSVDLCNWMQDDYEEEDPEILPIEIIFENVTKADNVNRKVDKDYGDEFLSVEIEDDETLLFKMVTSKEQKYYEIRVRAEYVKVVSQKADNPSVRPRSDT